MFEVCFEKFIHAKGFKMNTGKIVDDILKDSLPLDCTRFVVFHKNISNIPVPVDFLKAVLAEEHKSWLANMTRLGN